MLADRWGVTDAEVARRFGCDDVVAHPTLQAWRGVTVLAPPATVWAWVAQLRLAPYSYDWVDTSGDVHPGSCAGSPNRGPASTSPPA